MRNLIVNILAIIIFFNFIVIIFPEGKAQKYCKILIRIYIVVYILGSIIKSGDFNIYNPFADIIDSDEINEKYTRELNFGSINDNEIMNVLEKEIFNDEISVIDVILNYDNDIKFIVKINKRLNEKEKSQAVIKIAQAFKIDSDSISIIQGD